MLDRFDTRECNKMTFCPFCTASHYGNFKNPNCFRDSVRIFYYDLPMRKGHKPQLRREVSVVVETFSAKTPTYTKKDEQDQTICDTFHQKSDRSCLTKKFFRVELAFIASATKLSPHYTQFFIRFFTGATEYAKQGQWEVAISKNSNPSM